MGPKLRRLFSTFCIGGLALGASGFLCPATIQAETSAGARRGEAQDAVYEALHREIYGLSADRAKLLADAAEKSPDFAPARWHQGFVRDDRNRWVKAEDLLQSSALAKKLAAYDKARAGARDGVGGQLQLAEFCAANGLPEQRRAHLSRILELEPNHEFARQELGFTPANGGWVSRQQLQADFARARQEQASLAKWSPAATEIARLWQSVSQSRRELAVKRLGALRDPSAIAALERIVSPLDDDAARGVVELVSTMPGDEAALSLARHAVFYPSLPVRAAAAKKLAARDKFSFVPQLLALMYTPVTSQLFLAPTSGGIGLRHSFIREGLDQKEQLILDNEYVRVALPGGDGLESGFRALVDAAATAARREMLVAAQNEFAEKLNGRVGWVLKQTTGQDLPAQPEPWWNWWSDYNDLQAGGSKQVATIRQYAAVPVADRPQLSQGSRIVSECLVAGTLVWTAAGPVAIEKIRLGDLVLSQHADTGELAYKPVLRTTVREKRPLVKFTVAGETFQTTRGHVFWVSGEGWKKAGDLQSGMVLHTANGPARLSDLAPAADAQTYNLVVADFSSYFVGRAKLYSHDVTLRQPSRTLVPGLTPE